MKKSTFIIGIVITAVICIVGTSYGCNIEDNNKYTNSGNTNYIFGYWTSTAVVGISNGAWGVSRCGYLDNGDISRADYRGIRPVITISKSVLS